MKDPLGFLATQEGPSAMALFSEDIAPFSSKMQTTIHDTHVFLFGPSGCRDRSTTDEH